MQNYQGSDSDWIPAASGPSGANAAVQLVIEPRAGAKVCIGFLCTSYTAAAAAGGLLVQDGSGNSWDVDLPLAGPSLFNLPGEGVCFTPGQAVTLILKAGGAAVVGKIIAAYRYVYHR